MRGQVAAVREQVRGTRAVVEAAPGTRAVAAAAAREATAAARAQGSTAAADSGLKPSPNLQVSRTRRAHQQVILHTRIECTLKSHVCSLVFNVNAITANLSSESK